MGNYGKWGGEDENPESRGNTWGIMLSVRVSMFVSRGPFYIGMAPRPLRPRLAPARLACALPCAGGRGHACPLLPPWRGSPGSCLPG
eukprot:5722166-Pyramimonas_sp.AAC.1